jgi:hypothetical protein
MGRQNYTHKNKSEFLLFLGVGTPELSHHQLRQALEGRLGVLFVNFYRFFLSSRWFYGLHFLEFFYV